MADSKHLLRLMDKAADFHGHRCPGLAIGVRAAAWAMERFGTASDEEIVAVTETDMCAVDAIQALVGCTLGKGNLILHDSGKVAFSFFRRSDGTRARLLLRHPSTPQFQQRNTPTRRNTSTPTQTHKAGYSEEKDRREQEIARILSSPFESLFCIQEPAFPLPERARREPTLLCNECGEGVMASRLHELGGRMLCRDCAQKPQDR